MSGHPHDPIDAQAAKRLNQRYHQLMGREVMHVRVANQPGQSVAILGTAAQMHGPDGVCTDCHGRSGGAAKAAGQAAAVVAHPDDAARVEAAIRRLAATGREFSANDARSLHGVVGGVVGATFTQMRKAGVIEPVGDETSDSARTHGHRIFLWRGVAA